MRRSPTRFFRPFRRRRPSAGRPASSTAAHSSAACTRRRRSSFWRPPMSDATTHLLLPYILAAQAQKHVTHNEALRTARRARAALRSRPRPDRAARQPRRWRPLHRRLGRDGRLGGLGPERRALDRRRLAAPAAADRLAGMGRGRGPAAGLRRRGLGRHHARRRCRTWRCSGSAPPRMRRTRSRPS